MSIYNALVLACWLAFAVVWLVMGLSAKKSAIGFGGVRGTLFRVAVVAAMVIVSRGGHFDLNLASALTPERHPVFAALGVGCTALGIGFAVWARLHLGTNWGMPMTERENPDLVTSGPYAFVRHPIYTGMLLALLGSALVAGPWWLVIFCGGLVYFTYSAYREEKVMQLRFPRTYPAYRQRTRMLIPLLF